MSAEETTIEIAVRRARMDAARGSSAIVAAMAAGAGAELVAQQQLAREVLAMRLQRPRRSVDEIMAERRASR